MKKRKYTILQKKGSRQKGKLQGNRKYCQKKNKVDNNVKIQGKQTIMQKKKWKRTIMQKREVDNNGKKEIDNNEKKKTTQ